MTDRQVPGICGLLDQLLSPQTAPPDWLVPPAHVQSSTSMPQLGLPDSGRRQCICDTTTCRATRSPTRKWKTLRSRPQGEGHSLGFCRVDRRIPRLVVGGTHAAQSSGRTSVAALPGATPVHAERGLKCDCRFSPQAGPCCRCRHHGRSFIALDNSAVVVTPRIVRSVGRALTWVRLMRYHADVLSCCHSDTTKGWRESPRCIGRLTRSQ